MFFDGLALAIAALAAVIDVRTHRIPNALTYSALALGLALHHDLQAIESAAVVAVPLLPFALRGSMGGGDVKLSLALGAIVGTLDDAVILLIATSLAGAVLALGATLRARRFFGVRLTYGPAFFAGAAVVVVWRSIA